MTQDEIDFDWSKAIAEDVAEALVSSKVLAKADLDRAIHIASRMIVMHLVSGDRPERTGERYKNSN